MNSPLSDRDRLTGLFDRRTFHAVLRDSVEHTSRVALLLCDVDQIYPFNDKFGHLRGDEELCRISRDLERVCKPYSVFRVGGDEYSIVLPEASLEQAREAADKILASQPPQMLSFAGRAPAETLSLSIGIALFPLHALSDEHLLLAADTALLKAKRGGRLADGTPYTGRNRALAWGDFLDEFPEQSAHFLNPEFVPPQN